MRKVKFRAWDIFDKVMVYGNEHNRNDIWDGVRASSVQLVNDRFEEYRYAWMQFTGLKDHNGDDIYEGDIFEMIFEEDVYDENTGHTTVERKIRKKVYFENGSFKIDGFILFHVLSNNVDLRKVGNMYEHPELLEIQ